MWLPDVLSPLSLSYGNARVCISPGRNTCFWDSFDVRTGSDCFGGPRGGVPRPMNPSDWYWEWCGWFVRDADADNADCGLRRSYAVLAMPGSGTLARRACVCAVCAVCVDSFELLMEVKVQER